MGSPVNLKCIYVTDSDRTGRLVVQGRTRLFGLMSAGDTSGGGAVNITLKNGSSSGDTRLVLPTSHSGFGGAGAKYFGNAPFLDMQSRGILFEDGIYFTADAGIYAASLLVEGGKDNAS